jgi:hypothetical protein
MPSATERAHIMFDFEIIAERKITAKAKNGKKKIEKQVVELFSVLPAIDDYEVEKMIVSADDPLEAYVAALEMQAETVVFDEPIYNSNYQIIGTRKTFPLKERLADIIEKVGAYIDDGWAVRLVY